MSEKTVYLMRHGDAGSGDGVKRYIGSTDIPLSETGRRQAEALARWLGGRPVTAVYASAMVRAADTARAVAGRLGLSPVLVPQFHEVRMGDWEGMAFSEVRARWPEEYARRGASIAVHRPPGGESFAECAERVWPVFMGLTDAADGDIAIVAHAGVNRVLLCRMLRMDLSGAFRLAQDCGCVNVVAMGGWGTRVRLLNYVPESC